MARSNKSSEDPSLDEKNLLQWANNQLEDATERRRPHESQWWENICTYAGDLWTEYNVSAKRLEEKIPTAEHRVRIPINLAQPVVRTELAKLTKNRPVLNALAASTDKKDLDAAKVGDVMLNKYAERQFHLPKVRRHALMWVLTCGLGGIFLDWDEKSIGEQELVLDPRTREPVYDERLLDEVKAEYRRRHQKPETQRVLTGEFIIKDVSPFAFVWDMSQLYFEDGWWCIFTEPTDVDEVFRRWEVEVDPEGDAQPGVIERRMMSKASFGKIPLASFKNQRMAKVHRMYVRPGHRYFPNGLELIFTKDKIIKKAGFPWKHGQLPFSMMGHIPFPVTQYPLSVLGQIRGPVLELSKTESQLIENRNLMANIPWVEYQQNRLEDEITNAPGARIAVWYQPGIPDPHPVEMPEMPQYVKDLIPILKEHILDISGQGETSQGKVPAGARSGVAIAYLQEEDDTRLGPTVAEFEEMIERFGWQLLQGFAEKYDSPRTIRVYNGPNREPEVFNFEGQQLLGVAGVQCQAGSALPRSKAAKQQFILDLYDRGLEQDPRKVREMLELNEGEPDEWEIDMNQADRENRRMMQGQPVEVLEWHNHPAHHYRHRHQMKDEEWEKLPASIQQIFIDHDEAHSNFERTQRQELMTDQALTGGAAPQAPGAGGQQQIPLMVGNGQNQQTAPAQFTSPEGMGQVIESSPQ